MISLEQVNQLEIRVRKAVGVIKALRAENAALKLQVNELELSMDELKQEASSRKIDEQRLETSLQGVLDVLDGMDDADEIEAESSFKATIVENESGRDDTASGSSDSIDVDEEEAQVLSEPDDILFEENGFSDNESPGEPEDVAMSVEESGDESDDTPEEINLDESLDNDEDGDNKVQSEFDIF